jgi:hypothetical protein
VEISGKMDLVTTMSNETTTTISGKPNSSSGRGVCRMLTKNKLEL